MLHVCFLIDTRGRKFCSGIITYQNGFLWQRNADHANKVDAPGNVSDMAGEVGFVKHEDNNNLSTDLEAKNWDSLLINEVY